jgi:8-oxo-dGTP pyrophosphatase MutT (NUDIX family)
MNAIVDLLRKRLTEPLPGLKAQLKLVPEMRPQHAMDKNKTDAAVCLLLFPDAVSGTSIVLIKRATYNGHHSGQISFPGGKFELGDRSLEETAIRETHEELGIPGSEIKIIGKLTELYIPISKFLVHPFVAFTLSRPEFNIDKAEVDYLIFSTVKNLNTLEISSTIREYEGKNYTIPFYKIENEMVWGATSMILSEFIEIARELQLA